MDDNWSYKQQRLLFFAPLRGVWEWLLFLLITNRHISLSKDENFALGNWHLKHPVSSPMLPFRYSISFYKSRNYHQNLYHRDFNSVMHEITKYCRVTWHMTFVVYHFGKKAQLVHVHNTEMGSILTPIQISSPNGFGGWSNLQQITQQYYSSKSR